MEDLKTLFSKIFLDSSLILTYLYKGLYKIIRRIKNTIKEDALTLLMTQVKANISIRWIKPLTRDETEQKAGLQSKTNLVWFDYELIKHYFMCKLPCFIFLSSGDCLFDVL